MSVPQSLISLLIVCFWGSTSETSGLVFFLNRKKICAVLWCWLHKKFYLNSKLIIKPGVSNEGIFSNVYGNQKQDQRSQKLTPRNNQVEEIRDWERDWQTYKKSIIIWKNSKYIEGMSPKKFRKISPQELEISLLT